MYKVERTVVNLLSLLIPKIYTVVYPLLKNKEEWTYPSAEFCSAWTKQHPNTCLLDSKRNHSCIQPRSYAVSLSPSSTPPPLPPKNEKGDHPCRRGWAWDYIASYLHVSLRLVAVIIVAIITALPSYLILYIPDDSTTYWKIPAAGAYNWVAFDLGSEYTITGVRISGWYVGQVTTLRACYSTVSRPVPLVLWYCYSYRRDDKQMVHQFFVETAPALRYIYTRENINFDVVISSLYKVYPMREINTCTWARPNEG